MKRPYCEADTECAWNWWLLKLYFPMGHMQSFELRPDKPDFYPHERAQLEQIFRQFTLVTFNGLNYDVPMIKYALTGCGTHALKQLNDQIIVGGLKRWDVRKYFPQAEIDGFDHVDIMEVTPGVRIGLKTYMARMHSPTIQDLPFDPAAVLSEETIRISDEYCGNDLKGTRQLRQEVQSRLKLRERLTDRLNAEILSEMQCGIFIDRPITSVDLRSKSDAQMSEAIIAAKLGYRPEVPYIPSEYEFRLHAAPWLEFATPQMQEVFALCKNVVFKWYRNEEGEEYIGPDGKKVKTGVNMPPELKKLKIKIGSSVYKFGIGGLHSQESKLTMYSTEHGKLFDRDVGSFYPSLAILLKLFKPEVMAIYQAIYDQRMGSKATIKALKQKVKDAVDALLKKAAEEELDDIETIVSGLKIVMNGWYGKLWSKYSFALDPTAGIAITINGQLSLLMLIERLEIGGISVVSANTDGIICYVPKGLEWYYSSTFDWWEKATGLTTDETPYRSIHMRDVNSYVAIKTDGEVKRKGVFSESGINASMQGVHPDRDIAKDAAVQFLTDRTPIATTVRQCRDIRKFVLSRKVTGSGKWREGYLGSTVRWYYSTNGEEIRSINKNAKVAGSDGAQPIQVLPQELPGDVDYAKYEEYAAELLRVCGAIA